jgi:hypothetical protein
LAYSAATDGWEGVGNFAASFVGATVGAYAGSTVAGTIQAMLKNPATAQGGNQKAKVNEEVKQVKDGKTDRTSLVQSANNAKSDVGDFTAKVEAYAKLSGQEVDHQIQTGAFKFTARGVRHETTGPNWKTISIGLGEISGGVAGVASALAIQVGSLGTGSAVAGLRAGAGIMAIGMGVADVMMGIYGGRTSGELIGEVLNRSNNPFVERIYQLTPAGAN